MLWSHWLPQSDRLPSIDGGEKWQGNEIKIVKPIVRETFKEKIPCPIPNYTSQEVASRGEILYAQQIRDKVNPKHKGKFLVIDIETGEYEINDDDLVATKQLLTNHPNAVIYGLRIGYPAAYRIGSGFSVYTR